MSVQLDSLYLQGVIRNEINDYKADGGSENIVLILSLALQTLKPIWGDTDLENLIEEVSEKLEDLEYNNLVSESEVVITAIWEQI